MEKEFDVIIVGAGPSGCGLALALYGSGLRVAILDKEDFPRRKVCGGALSERSLNRLKEFPAELGLYEKFLRAVKKVPTYGLRVFSPGMNAVEFIFGSEHDGKEAPGYVCRRSDLDQFLLEQVTGLSNVTYFRQTKVHKITVSDEYAEVFTESQSFRSQIVAGADGANSLSRKFLAGDSINIYKDIGVSAHFENVTGFDTRSLIDIYFLKETLPGYFWIFRLPDGKANAGLGIEADNRTGKAYTDPKKLFEEIVSSHPEISLRFKNAERTDDLKGGILPMIRGKLEKQKGIWGNRYLLTGDAAGLVDPLNGEGIGNALTSAFFAAEAVRESFSKRDFSKKGLKLYGELLNKKLLKELVRHNRIRSVFYKNPKILQISLSVINGIKFIKRRIDKKLYKV